MVGLSKTKISPYCLRIESLRESVLNDLKFPQENILFVPGICLIPESLIKLVGGKKLGIKRAWFDNSIHYAITKARGRCN